MDHSHRYDAFLSYRRQEPDRTFVRDLLARLEKAGYTVAIDERDFVPNIPITQEMERCVRESRFTLAVVSPRYLDSGNCEEEAAICKVLDMGERKRRLLPLVIEKVEMPTWIYLLSGIDFTIKDPVLDPYEKLERTLGTPLRLADPDRFQIHPRVGEVFAGREKELYELEERLLGGSRPVTICALQGMPGVGKSYLAHRFYHLHTSRFPGGYQRLILDPSGPAPTAESLLGKLAERLKIQSDPVIVRKCLLQPRTLLHVENVDSRSLADATASLVKNLQRCPILVTGRYRLGTDGGWGRVEVRPFSEEEALDQLKQEIENEEWETLEEYRRLVKTLGYLPLAVHLAAGHLRAGRTVDGFLKLLLNMGLTLGLDDEADPDLAVRGEKALSETFNLSLDLLRKQLGEEGKDPDRLLAGFHILSQAPASGFGASLGATIANLHPSDFQDLVVYTFRLSVLEQLPATKRPDRAWRIHALLAELLRRKTTKEERQHAFDRMTDWFVSRFSQLPSGQEEEMSRRWREVQTEIDTLMVWLAQVSIEDQGRLDEAFRVTQDVFDKIGDIRERALTLGKIADILQERGQLDEALRIRQDRQLPVFKKIDDIREIALTLGKIADILQERGQLDEALRIRREEQIPLYEELDDIHSRAVTLGKIADILYKRGQLDESLKIRREEQLPLLEEIGDINERANTLDKIIGILQKRGQLNEAFRIGQEDQLPVYERFDDIPSQNSTLGQIVDILQKRGQLNEALSIRQEDQIPAYEEIGDIRSRAVILGQIADILRDRGQFNEALRIRQEDQIPAYERIGDARSLLVGRANLALIHLERDEKGDREIATDLLHQALETAERLRIPEADQIRAILQGIKDPEGDQV